MKEQELEIHDKFVELIGKEKIEAIKDNNWVSFDQKNENFYPGNIICINFKEKDGKNDTVIFMSVCYSQTNKVWWTESTVGEEEQFSTYQEAIDDYTSKEDDILENGDSFVEFN